MVSVVKTVGVGTQNKWLRLLSLFMEVSPSLGFTLFFAKVVFVCWGPAALKPWRTGGSNLETGCGLVGTFPFRLKPKQKDRRNKTSVYIYIIISNRKGHIKKKMTQKLHQLRISASECSNMAKIAPVLIKAVYVCVRWIWTVSQTPLWPLKAPVGRFTSVHAN